LSHENTKSVTAQTKRTAVTPPVTGLPKKFRIGLNMAGAVSAGAYTAGVLDFLIEAIDAWYEEKEKQRAKFGDDTSRWEIPWHDVSLEVLSGASAGGMCAAICAVALQEEFVHVRDLELKKTAQPVNRLYDSWVQEIDITGLLGIEDLRANPTTLRSVLDCTAIEKLADSVIGVNGQQRKTRKWVSPDLALILTVTNLRGIPYGVDPSNGESFEERINYHADEFYFGFGNSPANTANSTPLQYPPDGGQQWQLLKQAALATGAFPGMLAARILPRTKQYYQSKLWVLNNPDACSIEVPGCQIDQTVSPAWNYNSVPDTFEIVCADGGITNNNPFECARQYLVRQAGLGPSGHNPRSADKAYAAVISVAPFPGDDAFTNDYNAEEESTLTKSLSALVGTFLRQSRFQGENLSLIRDPDVHSRFAIAPSDYKNHDLPALLSGCLGAFGGFLDERFRVRDYQLGRKNCQRFLEVQFVLPEDNDVLKFGLNKRVIDSFRLDDPPKEVGTGPQKRWVPIIPLMPGLRTKVEVGERAKFSTDMQRVNEIAQMAVERLRRVANTAFSSSNSPHVLWQFLLNAILVGAEGKLEEHVADYLKDVLAEVKQLGQID